jgi:hypothetical protein
MIQRSSERANADSGTAVYLRKLIKKINEDLDVYENNMKLKKILWNCITWKSPDYTPYLDKNVIQDRFDDIIRRLEKEVKEHEIRCVIVRPSLDII